MTVIEILGVTLSILFSLFGLIVPKATARFIGLKSDSSKGEIEIMATYGGFFIGLALVTLIVNTDEGFDILGGAWVGAGIIRLIATAKYQKIYPITIVLALLEIILGALLIIF